MAYSKASTTTITSGKKRKMSSVFYVCYGELCKRQNLVPVSVVKGPCHSNKAVLDFSADRIKYEDWGPILNALACDNSLHFVAIRYRQHAKKVLDHIDTEHKLRQSIEVKVPLLTAFVLHCVCDALTTLIGNSTALTCLELEGIPLSIEYITMFARGIAKSTTLQNLSLQHCLIGDAACEVLARTLRHVANVATLDLSDCQLSERAAETLADLIKFQKISRYSESWKQTLRYREPDLDAMHGLRRLTLNNNHKIGDEGLQYFVDVLQDDLWMKALDLQNCGITDLGGQKIAELLTFNGMLDIVDLRRNFQILPETIQTIMLVLCKNCNQLGQRDSEKQFNWLSSTQTSLANNETPSSRQTTRSGVLKGQSKSHGDVPSSAATTFKRSNTTFLVGKRASESSSAVSRPKVTMAPDVWTPVKPLPNSKPSVAEQLKQAKTKIHELQLALEDEIRERKKVDILNEQLHAQMIEVMKSNDGARGDYESETSENTVLVDKSVLKDVHSAFSEFFRILPGLKINGMSKSKGDAICYKLQNIIEETPRCTTNKTPNLDGDSAPRYAKTKQMNGNLNPSGSEEEEEEEDGEGENNDSDEEETATINVKALSSSKAAPLTPRARNLFDNLLSLGADDSDDDGDENVRFNSYVDDENDSSMSSCSGKTTVRFMG